MIGNQATANIERVNRYCDMSPAEDTCALYMSVHDHPGCTNVPVIKRIVTMALQSQKRFGDRINRKTTVTNSAVAAVNFNDNANAAIVAESTTAKSCRLSKSNGNNAEIPKAYAGPSNMLALQVLRSENRIINTAINAAPACFRRNKYTPTVSGTSSETAPVSSLPRVNENVNPSHT